MSILDSYRGAVQLRSNLVPAEWARENVRLFRSTDSQFYRPEFTPWWNQPMREVRDNRNREICVTAPVGSGKSTMIEALVCNIQDQDPGPMMLIGQTDNDIQEWAETGLWPTMKACEPLKHKLPTARGKWRKDAVMIERSPIHITGANVSGTQSKSERWVIGDEAWLYDKGRFRDIRARLHRRWNGRAFFLGQAGIVQEGEDGEVVGDDFTLAADMGEQWEWCFSCPQCKSVQTYKLGQLKWPDEGSGPERAEQAVYECENCKTQFDDSSKTRRKFAQRSGYEKMREAKTKGSMHFHLNFIALWRAPWSLGVAEFIQATDSMKQGQSLPLQQFNQKQLAEPWNESMTIERPNLDFAEEKRADFANGEKIDDESIRFMLIDKQRDHYWVAVRAFRSDASSLGIYFEKIGTEETVERLREKMGVQPNHVYIDSGYEAGKVYDICARFGWIAVKGESTSSYTHKRRSGGKETSVQRLMSPRKTVLAPCGKRVPLIHLCADPIKDILARLRGGQGSDWQLVSDIGAEYAKQIDSESREEFLNPKTNQASSRWVRKRRDNHAWDLEYYAIGAALIWGIFSE